MILFFIYSLIGLWLFILGFDVEHKDKKLAVFVAAVLVMLTWPVLILRRLF